jgi:hypothetical protein
VAWIFHRVSSLTIVSMILAIGLAVSNPGAAAAEPALTLSNGTETLEFTLEELQALPQVVVVTKNEFSDGEAEYRGPLVRDILEHLSLDQADVLRFTAVNDYFVDIPTSDFRKHNVILAMMENGKLLSRRDKGPLWLMYPISDNSELDDPIYIHRLIWQVVRIETI